MSTLPTVRLLLRTLPAPWQTGFGLSMLLTGLGLVTVVGHFQDDRDVRLFWVQGCAVVACAWWPLMGAHLCAMVYRMLPMKVPGLHGILWKGIGLQILLSAGLPSLILLMVPAAWSDWPALLTALWMGSSIGLLLVSMPAILSLLPLLVVLLDGRSLLHPGFNLGLMVFACVASFLAWRWQLRLPRSLIMAPLGVWLDGRCLRAAAFRRYPLLERYCGRQALAGGTTRSEVGRRDLVAALLGPSCQTIRQVYGRNGQWLCYGVLMATALSLAAVAHWLGDSEQRGGAVLAVISIGGLMMAAQKPSEVLLGIASKRRAIRAELYLLPGLAGRKRLPWLLLRQLLNCLVERILLLVLVLPACLVLVYRLDYQWLLFWTGFAVLALLSGVISAWLAWFEHPRDTWYTAPWLLLSMFGMATHTWLLISDRSFGTIVALLWGLLLLFMACAGWRAWLRSRHQMVAQ